MSGMRRPVGLIIFLTMSIALLGMIGCESPAGLQGENRPSSTDQHPVPFRDGQPQKKADTTVTAGKSTNPEAVLPFHDAESLPAGTLLTVRLKAPISAANPGVNAPFDAIMDQAVVIEGSRLIPRGTTVSGRVESAKASDLKRDRGFVRLTLDAIHLSGTDLPIQTSSLFVRGNAAASDAGGDDSAQPAVVVRLEKGRRLTFRLSESVYVAASQHSPLDTK